MSQLAISKFLQEQLTMVNDGWPFFDHGVCFVCVIMFYFS